MPDPRPPGPHRDRCICSRAGPVRSAGLPESWASSQPNASQHLAVMRTVGLVEAVRDGREVSYRLTDPEIVVACQIMASVLRRHHQRYVEALEPAGSTRRHPPRPSQP